MTRLNNAPIGFFDSGVGGVTVFEQVKKLLPYENYIYFGDTKNMPYGEKTPEQLLGFARGIFDFFQKKGVKAVVMACNTTSAVVYDRIKNDYPFEIYPIIQPVTRKIAGLPVKKIGVFATKATVNSHCYKTELQKNNPDIQVKEIACPGWVKIVENGEENTDAAYLSVKEKIEEMLEFSPEKIILGCTHYPYLLKVLTRFAPEEVFINPSIEFAHIIQKDLVGKNLLNPQSTEGNEEFYVSTNPEKFKKSASLFYEIKTLPRLALN